MCLVCIYTILKVIFRDGIRELIYDDHVFNNLDVFFQVMKESRSNVNLTDNGVETTDAAADTGTLALAKGHAEQYGATSNGYMTKVNLENKLQSEPPQTGNVLVTLNNRTS